MRRPDPSRLRSCLLAAAALAAAAFACPALAAPETPPDKRLQELESALKKQEHEHELIKQRAEAQARELEAVKKDMVEAAQEAQEQEETLSALELRLRDLRKTEGKKASELELARQQTGRVLTAMQRLAWRPSEALIAQPSSPADTVRSAILLRAVLPKVREQADELREQLTALASVRADIAKERQAMAVAAGKLAGEHKRLAALFQRKAQMQAQTEEESRATEQRLKSMATEAQDLRELLAKLEEEKARRLAEEAERRKQDAERRRQEALARKQAPPPPPAAPAAPSTGRLFSKAQGEMPFPARGTLLTRFGQTNEAGLASKGITIETRSGAQIIAPYDGVVAFAGVFRGYGQLLIIEHSEGYHTLLAGMDRIDAAVGQKVSAGEPVGIMAESETKPVLYLELRRNGQPVNPMPWLTARKSKVNG